jgi:hypothetical protein
MPPELLATSLKKADFTLEQPLEARGGVGV